MHLIIIDEFGLEIKKSKEFGIKNLKKLLTFFNLIHIESIISETENTYLNSDQCAQLNKELKEKITKISATEMELIDFYNELIEFTSLVSKDLLFLKIKLDDIE